jgi:hypothetical protein
MCLLAYDDDTQSRAIRRRSLAAMAILLITMSLVIGFLHPQPGPDADMFDFLRGLMVGIGMVFSITAFTMCVRRPQNNS